jgi:hypothetical protein
MRGVSEVVDDELARGGVVDDERRDEPRDESRDVLSAEAPGCAA